MDGKRAAIYVRVSTGPQEDGYSLATQEQRCRQYCAEQGYSVARVFTEVHTGGELWERTQLTRVREAIMRGEIDVLVAYAIDRLSRNPTHLGLLVSEAEHYNCLLRFVTEDLDATPLGELIRTAKGFAAAVQLEKTREQSARGRRARVEAGKYLPGPRPPYGYYWADEGKTRLAEDPLTGPIVRRIFARLAAGGASTRAVGPGPERAPRSSAWRRTEVSRSAVSGSTHRSSGRAPASLAAVSIILPC